MLVTALVPVIGYDKASQIAHHAMVERPHPEASRPATGFCFRGGFRPHRRSTGHGAGQAWPAAPDPTTGPADCPFQAALTMPAMSNTPPKRGLARNTANYGDRDFALYLRRSFAKSMGYSQAMLDKPVVGHRRHRLGLQQLPPHRSRTDRGGEARRARGRRSAAGVPDRVAVRAVAVPDIDALSQPRRDRYRGDADRAADGRRRADRRLRQDGAGAIDGGGLGGHSGGATGHRADARHPVPGRASRRLHRLPPVLGCLSRRHRDARNASARSRAASPPPPAPAASWAPPRPWPASPKRWAWCRWATARSPPCTPTACARRKKPVLWRSG